VTIAFNLAQGRALGQAVDAIGAAVRQMGVPITYKGRSRARRRRSSRRCPPSRTDRGGALITVYIILGISS